MPSYIVPHHAGFKYKRVVPREYRDIVGRTQWTAYIKARTRREAEDKAFEIAARHSRLLRLLKSMSLAERTVLIEQGGLRNLSARTRALEESLPFVEAAAIHFGEVNYDLEDSEQADNALAVARSRQIGSKIRDRIKTKRRILAKIDGKPQQSGLMKLLEVWKLHSPVRNNKTRTKRALYLQRFIDVAGDMEPQEVLRAHAVKFRDSLEKEGIYSKSTIDAHLSGLSKLFKDAMSKNMIDSNPFHQVSSTRIIRKFAEERGRQPFSAPQVKLILDAAENVTEDLRWVIRLLAYHGARSGEITQLRVEDVIGDSEIPILRLTDEAGSLKNRFSLREVPIHPACIGIVEFASRTKGPWLFASFSRSQDKGRKFHNWASTWLRHTVGITDPKVTMHSLRHTWRTIARELGMPEPVSRSIMGHSMGRDDHGSYGTVPSLRLRADWMAKVDPLKE